MVLLSFEEDQASLIEEDQACIRIRERLTDGFFGCWLLGGIRERKKGSIPGWMGSEKGSIPGWES